MRTAWLLVLLWALPLHGQAPERLPVAFAGGDEIELSVPGHRGYPAVEAGALEPLGWQVGRDGVVHRLLHRTGLELRFTPTSPYFRWDGELLQLMEAPYVLGGDLFLPLQLLTDFFPALLPDAYRYDGTRLHVAEAPTGEVPAPTATVPEDDRPRYVVVIDPGHGGEEPGAIGAGGVREKDVALAIGLALRRELAENPDLEVRMTRDRDVLVPIWDRGDLATEWKDGRTAVFLSIHANAVPDRPGVRGFETYFLSEARTEHERRVAAAENAPLRSSGGGDDDPDPILSTILRDLRAFDHQQWSFLLADLVQQELGTFHPGPDRGVKQAPLAVLTNALMPAVLIEVGFVTNVDEARLLARPEFHRDTARALARAVDRFFERYPAGGG